MPHIDIVNHLELPNALVVGQILGHYNMTIQDFYQAIHIPTNLNPGAGIQIQVHDLIIDALEYNFQFLNNIQCDRNGDYPNSLGALRPDLKVTDPNDMDDSGIYIEVEFRPQWEKDLYKFILSSRENITLIQNRNSLGVLVLANNRNTINPLYYSMPQYLLTSQRLAIIHPFSGLAPLLILGVDII